MAQSIFERVGGMRSVSRIIRDFYGSVMDEPALEPYFRGVDMSRLIDHQTKFIAFLMGGPASFTDEHIARVHAHLGINESGFENVVMILRETMEDHDMDESDIGNVISVMRTKKNLVVTA